MLTPCFVQTYNKMADLYKMALEYHRAYPKGKLATIPTKPHSTQRDLSLAYSPGVAAPSHNDMRHTLGHAPA